MAASSAPRRHGAAVAHDALHQVAAGDGVDRRGAHDDELLRLAAVVPRDRGALGRRGALSGFLGRAGLCGGERLRGRLGLRAWPLPRPSSSRARRPFAWPRSAACCCAACCGRLLLRPCWAACLLCGLLLRPPAVRPLCGLRPLPAAVVVAAAAVAAACCCRSRAAVAGCCSRSRCRSRCCPVGVCALGSVATLGAAAAPAPLRG